MRTTLVQSFLILLLGLFLMREARQQPARAVDEVFANWLAANSPHTDKKAPLTVIEINDSSLQSGHDWPWSPLDFALFFQAALPLNPRVIALEPMLSWTVKAGAPEQRSQSNSQYERILRDQILRSPRILLSARLGFADDPTGMTTLEDVPTLRHVLGDRRSLAEFTTVAEQPEEKFRLSAARGFTNLPEASETLRRVPLVFRYHGEVVPSFTLQAIMLWLRTTPDDVNIELGERIWIGNRLTIPIDREGNITVDFSVGFSRYGYDDLLLAAQQIEAHRTPIVPPAEITDRLVLLARTDAAARTLDLPSHRRGSTGELFAAAIATIQTGSFYRRVSWVVDFVILAVMVGITPACMRRQFSTLLIGFVSLAIAYIFLCLVLFNSLSIWLPILLPGGLLLGVALSWLLSPRQI